jgi:hypothetical protein
MDKQTKHLEFILVTISRMANNSFLLKGWTITLVSAFIALLSTKSCNVFFFFSSVPVIVFWILDSFYLCQERKYRALYDLVRNGATTDFSMNTSDIKTNNCKMLHVIFSKTLFAFYFSILLITTVITFIACFKPNF